MAITKPLDRIEYYKQKDTLLQVAKSNCSAQGQSALRGFLARLCDFGSALVNREGPGAHALGVSPRGSTPYSCPEICVGLVLQGTIRHALGKVSVRDQQALHSAFNGGYDAFAADVWSFAITVFTLVYGREPFRAAFPHSSTYRAFVHATQPHVLRDAVMCPDSGAFWAAEAQHLPQVATGGSLAVRLSVSDMVPPSWCWPDCFSPALVHLLGGCLRVREGERFSMEEVAAHPWFKNPSWVPPCGATLMSQSSSGLLPSSMLGLSHGIPVSPAALPFGDTHHHSTDDILDSTEHCNVFGECDTPVVSLDYPVGVGVLAELQPIVRESAQGMQPLRLPPSNESTSGAAAAASSAVSSSTANPAASAAGAGGGSGRWGSSLSASAGMPSLDTAVSGREADWAGALPLQPVPPDCKLDAAAHSPRTKRSVVPASQSVQLQSYAQKALRPAGWQEHDTSVHM